MSTSITIRNLDKEVKQRLRVIAAQHGKSMEAEARDILTRAAFRTESLTESTKPVAQDICSSVRGIWKGRFTTDEFMEFVRGD